MRDFVCVNDETRLVRVVQLVVVHRTRFVKRVVFIVVMCSVVHTHSPSQPCEQRAHVVIHFIYRTVGIDLAKEIKR